MNKEIMTNAAIYVNSYRNSFASRGRAMDCVDVMTLRKRVSIYFGAEYAAVLVN